MLFAGAAAGRLRSTVAVRLADRHDLCRVSDGGGGVLSGQRRGNLDGYAGRHQSGGAGLSAGSGGGAWCGRLSGRTDPQKGVRAAECLCLRRRVRNGAVAFRAAAGGLDGALSAGSGGIGVVSAQGAHVASHHLSAHGSHTAAGGGSICRAAADSLGTHHGRNGGAGAWAQVRVCAA